MHDIQTQVLDVVDGVDSGVTAIDPLYTQLQAASMSSWNLLVIVLTIVPAYLILFTFFYFIANRPEDNSENQASKGGKPKVSENIHESGSVIGGRESGRARKKKVDPEYVY